MASFSDDPKAPRTGQHRTVFMQTVKGSRVVPRFEAGGDVPTTALVRKPNGKVPGPENSGSTGQGS